MTSSYKMRADKSYQVYRGNQNWVCLFGLITILLAIVLMVTSCEPAVRLSVENLMVTDVTIVIQRFDKDGAPSDSEILGTVPTGQTVKLPPLFTLSPDIIGWFVLLRDGDPAGNVVWQKSWPFEEFLKLRDVGWKIVISPETSS